MIVHIDYGSKRREELAHITKAFKAVPIAKRQGLTCGDVSLREFPSVRQLEENDAGTFGSYRIEDFNLGFRTHPCAEAVVPRVPRSRSTVQIDRSAKSLNSRCVLVEDDCECRGNAGQSMFQVSTGAGKYGKDPVSIVS